MTDFLHYCSLVSAHEDGRWRWTAYSRWDSHADWTNLVSGGARWKWLASWRGAKRVRHLRHRAIGRKS